MQKTANINKKNGREMERYREMPEIPWQKKILRSIFQQPGKPNFGNFSFGVNCSGGGTSESPEYK